MKTACCTFGCAFFLLPGTLVLACSVVFRTTSVWKLLCCTAPLQMEAVSAAVVAPSSSKVRRCSRCYHIGTPDQMDRCIILMNRLSGFCSIQQKRLHVLCVHNADVFGAGLHRTSRTNNWPRHFWAVHDQAGSRVKSWTDRKFISKCTLEVLLAGPVVHVEFEKPSEKRHIPWVRVHVLFLSFFLVLCENMAHVLAVFVVWGKCSFHLYVIW